MDELSLLDYELPPDRIAQTPLEDRSASKLLHLNRANGQISHLAFRDCVRLLRAGDLLVMNETRVTAMRLFGRKPTGGNVELLLLKELAGRGFEALVRPGKRLRAGATVQLEAGLTATIQADLGDGRREVEVAPQEGIAEKLNEIAFAPLPPYIHADLRDRERYQTVYAKVGGSAAAPTAGLHFTPELLREIQQKGVEVAKVSLDVGLDTFRPIQGDPAEHKMLGERCSLGPDVECKVAECKGRVIAVGTTTARTLESFALGKRQLATGEMNTDIFIRPGYEFQIVDGMFTNFHMPRTSMLLMIGALAGVRAISKSYEEALKNQYRFLSFGDSMLIL